LIPFTKAHACGNDFLIVTEEATANHNWAELTRSLCARNTGVGADGIEFFAWTGTRSGRIRLHNADGSVAEISGNGTRCVAAWMTEAIGAKAGDMLEVGTDAGVRVCRVNSIDTASGFSVQMTTGMGLPTVAARTVTLANGAQIAGAEISMGNPHFVLLVDNAEFAVAGRTWQEVGAEICFHADFPNQTNVDSHLRARRGPHHFIGHRQFRIGCGGHFIAWMPLPARGACARRRAGCGLE